MDLCFFNNIISVPVMIAEVFYHSERSCKSKRWCLKFVNKFGLSMCMKDMNLNADSFATTRLTCVWQ